jgi:hypothetical protein
MVEKHIHDSPKGLQPLVVFLCAVLGALGSTFAQDARTDALGGISIINGFSHILYNPASINDFPDQIMGSTGSYVDTNGFDIQYFGPFILKKSLTKNISIGCSANNENENGSSALRSKFYQNAHLFLDPDSSSPLPLSFPMIPHLMIGVDLKPISLAVEGFVEASHFKKSIANTGKYSEKGIYNVGGKLNANISLGTFWFCPLAGLSFPSISGSSKDSSILTDESPSGSSVIVGSEVGMDLDPSTVVAGVYRTSERYQFAEGAYLSPEYGVDYWDLYAGFTTILLSDVTVACQYDLTIEHDKIVDANPASILNIDGHYLYHAFRIGVEKPFAATHIFDAVTPRAGMVYRVNNYNEQVADTLTPYALSAADAELNAGIGFTKSIFCLDLFVNLGNWNGALAGPKAVSATLSVGFLRP